MPDGVVVFYSWVGSTRVAAEEIHRLTGFGLQEIREVRERKRGAIMGAAMGAMLGLKSRIRPPEGLEAYGDVLLGTPGWAGKTPPAINAFLARADLRGKRVWLFITQGDVTAPSPAAESVTRRVEERGGRVMDVLRLKTRWDPKTSVPIPPEEIRDTIGTWVGGILPRIREDGQSPQQ